MKINPKHPNTDLHLMHPDAFGSSAASDGTNTIFQVVFYDNAVGTGWAKRRKTDPRNDELGMALATARAFAEASEFYFDYAERIMNPDPDPSAAAIKDLRRRHKADTRRRKNIRREKARIAHREVWGWDHNDRPEGLTKASD